MITFDSKGYLKPYEIIEIDLQTFQTIFVEDFIQSETRQNIFLDYFDFIHDFKNLICPNVTYWLNGSFVSKKLNPKDLDIVVFIDFEVYEAKKDLIEDKFNNLRKEKKYPHLDIYTVKVYPLNHLLHFFYLSDKAYWNEWFSTTRLDKHRKQHHKGFIQLQF